MQPTASPDAAKSKERGNELMKAGNYAQAVEEYKKALDLGAGDGAAALYSNLSFALLKLRRLDESLAEAERCIGAKADWPKAYYRRGDALFELQRYDEAHAAYSEALKLNDKDKDIEFALKLAEEAKAGGVWHRQLLPGRDIAIAPSDDREKTIFGAAKQLQNYIYLCGDARSRECYVVDPCWDTNGIVAYASRCKMKIIGAVPTHYHFDHAGGLVHKMFQSMIFGPFGPSGEPRLAGLLEMQRDHGCEIFVHEQDAAKAREQCSFTESTPLSQGTKLPMGDAGTLEVFHTPGHTPGSICLCVTPTGADKPSMLYTGDTIFPGSTGRMDFPDSSIDAMFDSLSKLRQLDDATVVYPGHAYGGASTTIAKEKANGMLRPFTREMWNQMH